MTAITPPANIPIPNPPNGTTMSSAEIPPATTAEGTA
jgi:hypothetical protein